MPTLRSAFSGFLLMVLTFGPALAQPAGRASDRQHHYVFAHRVMPRLFYRDAAKLSNALAERRAELLRAMWIDLGEQFFSTAQVAPDGIDVVVPAATGGTKIVVLVFPKPEASAEAWFAALVTKPDGSLQYLTLEKAIDLFGDGAPATVLGGWDPEGAHLNFGEGSKPTVEEFEKRVRAFLENPTPVSAGFVPPRSDAKEDARREG